MIQYAFLNFLYEINRMKVTVRLLFVDQIKCVPPTKCRNVKVTRGKVEGWTYNHKPEEI